MFKLRKEQLFRYKKYFILHFPHLTIKKIINILKVEWKLKKNDTNLRNTFPYILFVDPYNKCNLKCPLCFRGKNEIIERENKIDITTYEKLINPLKKYLFQIFLYNNSEPFLNKDIYRIINYNKINNIGTVVSSNLSLKIDPKKMVESGLEYLIVSADGITQEIYEKYRVGGKLDVVVNNIKQIIIEKRRLKSKFPYIEWNCIVTKKNENHIDDIREFAYNLGVDTVRFANVNFFTEDKERKLKEDEWLPNRAEFREFKSKDFKKRERKACFWLWRTAVINPDGSVLPCCLYDTEDFGNSIDNSFLDIWNNEKYLEARSLSLSASKFKGGNNRSNIICRICNADFIYKKN